MKNYIEITLWIYGVGKRCRKVSRNKWTLKVENAQNFDVNKYIENQLEDLQSYQKNFMKRVDKSFIAVTPVFVAPNGMEMIDPFSTKFYDLPVLK